MEKEWIVERMAALCPRGIPPTVYGEIANILWSELKIMALQYKLVWNDETGAHEWVNKQTGEPDHRPSRGGCSEIAQQGYAHVNTGNARPKKGDLKPSDSLLRDLNGGYDAALRHRREEARRALEEIDRELERGQLLVHPDAHLGNDPVVVPIDNGKRMVVPSGSLTAQQRLQMERDKVAREEAAYAPQPQAPRLTPVETDASGATTEERLAVLKAMREAPPEVARMSLEPDPKAKPPQRDPGVREADLLSFDSRAFPCIPKS